MRTLRLQVTLRGVTPLVRRLLDVPAASTVPELHELLQAGLGWTNSHLHEFILAEPGSDPWAAGVVRYGIPDPDVDGVEPVRDQATAWLRDLGAEFVYLYDFGDGWAHDVTVLGPGADRAGCVYGEGACPPEDCGGPTGYADLLAVLADPTRDDHARMCAWAGPPVEFDPVCTDALLRRTAGAVPAGVALLLGLLQGGVPLTPGGWLSRALVRAVQEQRPDRAYDDRPGRREEDLPALAALHDLLREVGLLRLRHGVVVPTRAASDELGTVRRLRYWFGPDEGFTSVLAATTVATIVVNGPQRLDELAQRVHPLRERSAHRDGTSLTPLRSVKRSPASLRSCEGSISSDPTAAPGRAGTRPTPCSTGPLPWPTSGAFLVTRTTSRKTGRDDDAGLAWRSEWSAPDANHDGRSVIISIIGSAYHCREVGIAAARAASSVPLTTPGPA